MIWGANVTVAGVTADGVTAAAASAGLPATAEAAGLRRSPAIIGKARWAAP